MKRTLIDSFLNVMLNVWQNLSLSGILIHSLIVIYRLIVNTSFISASSHSARLYKKKSLAANRRATVAAAAAAMLVDQNSSSEECLNTSQESDTSVLRRKARKKNAVKLSAGGPIGTSSPVIVPRQAKRIGAAFQGRRELNQKQRQQTEDEDVQQQQQQQMMSEGESLSDPNPTPGNEGSGTAGGRTESDEYSDSDNVGAHMQWSDSAFAQRGGSQSAAGAVFPRRHPNTTTTNTSGESKDGDDFAGDDSYSSPTSNQSEKNMGDFDDEMSPNEDQVIEMAASLRSYPLGRAVASGMSASPSDIAALGLGKAATAAAAFKYHELCEPGNTLLWDLLQDDKIGQLGEQLAIEAEKALATLLCFNTDRQIRTRFIEGCLENLAQHRSVIVSLRLLPKLFASFQQFRTSYTHYITVWAERQHNMMTLFFADIKHYAQMRRMLLLAGNGGGAAPAANQQVTMHHSHVTQVQVRLQFLTYIFSAMGSPITFRLNLEQVDDLWAWLHRDEECADCLFAWLQSQMKNQATGEQHALGVDALQHLYNLKLPELQPEAITMVALGLFQQLCSLARHYEQLRGGQHVANRANLACLLDVGMTFLWKIALRAQNAEVSLAAIQYINTYYLGQQLKLEEEFIAQCMNHLAGAVMVLTEKREEGERETAVTDDELTHQQQESALMYIQRALMLLSSHLETFRRKYAYHLRRWQLEGANVIGSLLAGEVAPLRIVIQPAGMPEKHVLRMRHTDLVADLKAEISKWWEMVQGGERGELELPLRIITQGQEITGDYDERSLVEVNFKDNQIVYVSLGGRNAKKRDSMDLLMSPQSIPTVLLLQPKYFEQLFQLMHILGDMTMHGGGVAAQLGEGCSLGTKQPHTKAQLLSRRVWDILAMLPTNPMILEMYTRLGGGGGGGGVAAEEKCEGDVGVKVERKAKAEEERQEMEKLLEDLLNTSNLQKFLYSMHVLESFCKAKNIQAMIHPEGAASVVVKGSPTIQSKLAAIEQLKQSISILHANQFRKGVVSGDESRVQSAADTGLDVPEINELKLMNEMVATAGSPTTDTLKRPPLLRPVEESGGSREHEQQQQHKGGVEKQMQREQEQEKEEENPWIDGFVRFGGLKKIFAIFVSGQFQRSKHQELYSEWRHDCLANLLRVLCIIGIEDVKKGEQDLLRVPRMNEAILMHMPYRETLKTLATILADATADNPAQEATTAHTFRTGFWCRAQVVQFAMNLLVSFVHSSRADDVPQLRAGLWAEIEASSWLERLILHDPDPAVRRETCAGLYRICLGDMRLYVQICMPLLRVLVEYLPQAEQMRFAARSRSLLEMHSLPPMDGEPGKEPFGPACRDFFWLLCRLVDNLSVEQLFQKAQATAGHLELIDVDRLCDQVAHAIVQREIVEVRRSVQDDGLVGLLNLMANLLKLEPHFKVTEKGGELLDIVYECLFELPNPGRRNRPRCKSQLTRAAAYDLLIELCRNAPENYSRLHEKLMLYHSPLFHAPYPWDYWPRDDGRAECGYVGLTNLGATCYMASCIQHLYMMPQAREEILRVVPSAAKKHETMLQELQRMFVYLLESEKKTYNPRGLCRVYQMDHQPLNTGEQKDMAEFFIDLVSKLEEMTLGMKGLVKTLFCGMLSNNVVSLDCEHVSRTAEEFYTVRCQVADMRNLYESLDEVTVKDTLDGDNMYTCSQCGKKVRAEKRACFRTLPQILCFNTMRYTFNMVTMLKEKVNTHFSFPMRLNMADYLERKLVPERREGMEQAETESTEYTLIGVTVHTGTADGGHYYSFIKERCASRVGETVVVKEEEEQQQQNQQRPQGKEERWFLFNDAEVKVFDSTQIAAECFGGEMTVSRRRRSHCVVTGKLTCIFLVFQSKTYDSATEKYLDFSFEKTNSAYMLFYERVEPQQKTKCGKNPSARETSTTESMEVGKEESELRQGREEKEEVTNNRDDNTMTEVVMNEETVGDKSTTEKPEQECDIDDKVVKVVVVDDDQQEELMESNNELEAKDVTGKEDNDEEADGPEVVEKKPKLEDKEMERSLSSGICKELEDWIWQDNKNFLQDVNIFEHTYFK